MNQNDRISIDLSWLNRPVPAMPSPSGEVVEVNCVDGLLAAAKNAQPGTTILVAEGVYQLPETVLLEKDGLTLMGNTDNRDKVVLKGNGFYAEDAGPRDIVTIQYGKKITVANLTIQGCDHYGISIQGHTGPHEVHIFNVKFIDIGQRSIKGNAASYGKLNADYGLVEHCYFEQTKPIFADRQDGFGGNYVAGMDLHGVKGWIIRDNIFLNIQGATGEGRAAIFVWNNSIDTIVERNLIIGCDRGIAIGNPHGPNEFARAAEKVYHHTNGVVRNNFIYSLRDRMSVELVKTRGLLFANNTIFNDNPQCRRSVEYSFPATSVKIVNNLVRGEITSLEGGKAELVNNLTQVPDDWFMNPCSGDLRLTAKASQAVGAGVKLEQVTDDFMGNPRLGVNDIGAHQISGE